MRYSERVALGAGRSCAREAIRQGLLSWAEDHRGWIDETGGAVFRPLEDDWAWLGHRLRRSYYGAWRFDKDIAAAFERGYEETLSLRYARG